MQGDINQRVAAILSNLYDGNISRMAKALDLKRTSLQSVTGSQKSAPGFEMLQKIAVNSSPAISLNWLITGEGPMLRSDEKADTSALMNEDLVPDIPMYALAGKTDDILSGIMPAECTMLPRIPDVPRYDITIHVRGDSMEPTFVSGDRLAVRRVLEIYEWGAPYVLETEEGVYFKRVKNDGPNVICISDNPEYQPFKIEKDKIRSAYRVAAVLRIL